MGRPTEGPRQSTRVLALIAAVVFAACSDDPAAPTAETAAVSARPSTDAQDRRGEFISVRRLDPEISIQGSLRPTQALKVRSSVKANRPAANARYELWS